MSLRTLSLGVGLFCLFSAPACAETTNLFATHHGTQKVHTLQLTQSGGNYTLSETAALRTCGTYPRWITLDPETRIIYCSERRGLRNIYDTENATLTALSVEDDGTWTKLASTPNAPGGGVHNVVYKAAVRKFLAVVHNFYASIPTFALP
ncbi:hypothetical protein BDW60DRAFT_212308 [Aspergillus nidulans var. acristatus]